LNDKEEIDFMGLIGNLKTHEMERKVIKDKVVPKKKIVAFKSTLIRSDDNEVIDNEENVDEELSLLVKNMRRMFYKRGRFNNYRKERKQDKDERRGNEIGPCYNYKKFGQLIADCPEIKNKTSSSNKSFKKKRLLGMTRKVTPKKM